MITGNPILDKNLLKSKNENSERLWVLTRINGLNTAEGVVYLPNDGINNKNKTDEIMVKLLEDVSNLYALGYEVVLTDYYNGRCIDLPFS